MDTSEQPNQAPNVKAILDRIVDEDPATWPTLVARHCGSDEPLATAVMSHLQTVAEKSIQPEYLFQEEDLKQAGPYQILNTLGRGGMGVVFLAERTDQFRQKVAIKCLRSTVAGREGATRLKMERQILARLNHVHIAKVLDGGVTAGGLPYFVMEYIEGIPITRYARERQLSLAARLSLFQQVCLAVHYAHQHLIIHRDLKPGNILVSKNGVVKLLDFGIAKLLNREDPFFSDLTRLQTGAGHGLMTPRYGSPEQFRGDPPTVATDIHALGLLLYELLTGRPAFNLERKSRLEMEHIVLNELPKKPSSFVEKVDPDAPTSNFGSVPSEFAGLSGSQLRAKLRGDLDCIAMMALRKDPSRRYQSARDLHGDIAAYLQGQPVSAHPEKWTYRLGKYVRRNKLWVGFAAVLVFSFLALGVGSFRFAQVTRSKNEQIVKERDQAQAISKFLVSLLNESDPLVQRPDTTILDLLSRAKAALETDFPMDEEVKTQLYLSLVDVYFNYGDLDAAEGLIEKVLAGNQNPLNLGRVQAQKAFLLGEKGLFSQAWSWYEDAETNLTTGGQLKALAELKIRKGAHQTSANQFTEALETLEGALSLCSGKWPLLEIVAWRNLGWLHGEMRHLDRAHQSLDRAQALIRTHLGASAYAQLDVDFNRALALALSGNLNQALQSLEEGIPKMKKLLGAHHGLICNAIELRALCLEQMGKYDDSLSLRLVVLECLKAAYGSRHFQVGLHLNEVGENYYLLGDFEKAIGNYLESLAVLEMVLPARHLHFSTIHANLGNAYTHVKQPEQGLIHTRKAYEITKGHADSRYLFGGCALIYGYSLKTMGRFAEAIPILEEALAVAKEFPGLRQFPQGIPYYQLGHAHLQLNQESKGMGYLELAVKDFLQVFGPSHQRTQRAYEDLKQLYQEHQQSEKLRELDETMANGNDPAPD